MNPKEKEVTAPADICFHKLLHREDKEDMSFKLVNELPSPAEILEQFPLPEKLAVLKAERDEEIKKVITGESNKFLVIIGPCSADNEDAVCDYTNRLAKVQEKTKDRLLMYQEFIPISQEPQAKAIWACSTSLILRKSRICSRESFPSVICT